MNSEETQDRNGLARQIVRALKDGERIVDSIAKGDGKWKAMTVDGRDFVKQIRAEIAEENEREGR
jgi:hypothetical protein